MKVLDSYKKYRQNQSAVWVVFFPVLLIIKTAKRICILIANFIDYVGYRLLEKKNYSLEYLKKATDFRHEDQLVRQIKEKKTFLCDSLDRIAIEAYKRSYFQGATDKIKQANLICDHVFDLLGSGPVKVTSEDNGYQPIDWQQDFKSGYRWNPKRFFRWIRFGNVSGADVIVPWEMSRFQDRMVLAQAYLLTKEPKFAIEFQNQVTDWIDNNPIGFGINWLCAMDTSFRAVNFIVIKEMFETDFDFPEPFLVKFYGSLYDHGRYIRKHLQRLGGITNNHYISGIAGLLFIGLYCPFFDKSREWLDFAVQELEKEIKRQVYADGCDYEASTSYHLLVLEIFFYALLLCDRAGVLLSESYKDTLKKMFEASLYYMKPNGMAPQVGDNDNGRFLKYCSRPVLEHEYLLSLAAVYFRDNNFKLEQFDFAEERFWIFGKKGKEIYDSLPYRKEVIASKAFNDAGWYILRHNNNYCFITSGPTGQNGNGGHGHNDDLSFELMVDGQDIIVDPGTYVYTPYPKERNKFRSTEYHNTMKFDGYEQNEIFEKDLFYLPDRVTIRKSQLKETADRVCFNGEIQYSGITHKRTITLHKESDTFHIKDGFSCPKPTSAKLVFHLSPDVIFDNNHICSKNTGREIASINVEGHQLEKTKYDYSPQYGVKTNAECLVANVSATEEMRLINTFIKKL